MTFNMHVPQKYLQCTKKIKAASGKPSLGGI